MELVFIVVFEEVARVGHLVLHPLVALIVIRVGFKVMITTFRALIMVAFMINTWVSSRVNLLIEHASFDQLIMVKELIMELHFMVNQHLLTVPFVSIVLLHLLVLLLDSPMLVIH